MSAKLWFLQDIEDIMTQNQENFGTGKNSYYNKLFYSVYILVANKYFQREAILQEMEIIYQSETSQKTNTHIGFVLPSKKKKEGELEFGLSNAENIEEMRLIRAKNDKLNEELFILQDFLRFLACIDPRSEIFEEQHIYQLQSLFTGWWGEQMESLNAAQTQSLSFDGNGEVPASQRSDT